MTAARIVISEVAPQVDCGRWPAKACVGDRVAVAATIVRDGHDPLRAVVRHRRGRARWREEPLRFLGNDRFAGSFPVDAVGRWQFEIEAWVDRHAAWLDEHDRKVAAGQTDLAGELAEGEALFGAGDPEAWRAAADALGSEDRHGAARSDPLPVEVERARARAGAWYELFPRSWGGLRGVAEVVPALAEHGFDVLYLPPIHPIGVTNRKGRNNTERAASGDVGSPWAIGAAEGGHDAIDPALGDEDDLAAPRRGAPRARDGARARPRAAGLARPPVAPGASRVVPAPARRLAQVRGEPAEALSGHPQLRLGHDGPEGAVGGVPRRRAAVVRGRRHGVPGRQPAHEADPVLGVADRRRPQAPSRDDLSLRGVHAAGADDAPREGGLLAVLHVLHLEEHEAGARRARRAAARVVAVPAAEPLAEHPGHPPRDAPAGRAPRLRVQARPRRDPLAELRHLLGLRALRERPGAARQRGVPRLREVRGARPRARRAAPAPRNAG